MVRELMGSSPAGQLLSDASTFDFALGKHFTVALSDIPCDVFAALRIIEEERARVQELKLKHG